MPTTPQDAYTLLRAAVRDDNPVVVLEHRWFYDIVGPVDYTHQDSLGKAMVRRKGSDLSILSTSWMTVEALQAAEILKRHNLDIEVVDVRSIGPLDENTLIQSVKKTKHCLIADYDWTYCGFSGELAALISETCFKDLKMPIPRLGFAFAPCPTTRPLESRYFSGAEQIVRKVESMFGLSALDLKNEEFYTYENRFKGPF
jgi:pyruvate dehydrogenase E1 component beta subunit